MRFIKMQGTGNDFILIDCPDGKLPGNEAELAKKMCDRHFGVGADGLVFVLPGTEGDFRMEIWNADGSRAAMCGNATRCIGVRLFDQGRFTKDSIALETASGIRLLRLAKNPGGAISVQVCMGIPRWTDSCLPRLQTPSPLLDYPLDVNGRTFRVNCVSMGNPHCVIYTDDLSDELVLGWGPQIERHPFFPDRTNVEFARIESRSRATVRVWERGCGETMACGTGASAVFAVSASRGLADGALDIAMPGGVLRLEYSSSGEEKEVLMSGPAKAVFEGNYIEEKII